MNKIEIRFFTLIFFCAFQAQAGLKKKDITTWPKASVVDFGCFLEKEWGYKDGKFNCSLKKYVNKGDPCLNTTEYYEGPKIPNTIAKQIDSKVESIDLIWERGQLQSVALTLDNKYPEKELRKKFKLPTSAQVQDCGKKNSCMTLIGFDHLGAGDADCGDE